MRHFDKIFNLAYKQLNEDNYTTNANDPISRFNQLKPDEQKHIIDTYNSILLAKQSGNTSSIPTSLASLNSKSQQIFNAYQSGQPSTPSVNNTQAPISSNPVSPVPSSSGSSSLSQPGGNTSTGAMV